MAITSDVRRLVSVLPPWGNTRTSGEPGASRAAVDPAYLRGYHGSQKPYSPRSVKACQEGSWTLAMLNRSTGEIKVKPFRCKSWRCKRCAPLVNKLEHDRIEAGLSAAAQGSLAFLTLTFDRKRYATKEEAWRATGAAWKRLKDKLCYHYGERGRGGRRARIRYVLTYEQHKTGWPHIHALVESQELMADMMQLGSYQATQRGREITIYRWTRKVLRPMLLSSGFGPIAHTEPPENLGGMAGYLVKIAAELTGSHAKQDQTPIRAPKGFRRLRATPGFLPSRKTANDWTGKLEKCKTETIERALKDGKYQFKDMAKTEECPECGEMFDPRGIRLHRKAKHGVEANTATVNDRMAQSYPAHVEVKEVREESVKIELEEPKDEGIGFW